MVSKPVAITVYFRGVRSLRQGLSGKSMQAAGPYLKEIYFGEEFCERRSRSAADIREAYNAAVDLGMKFSLMTGVATNKLLDEYRGAFDFLARQKSGGVVVNDLGVLNCIRRDYKSLKVTLGRLLCKNKRFIFRHFLPDTGQKGRKAPPDLIRRQLKALRQTAVAGEDYRNFLRDWGVRRVDLDLLPQGMSLEDTEDMDMSVYIPWGFLTSDRCCEHGRGQSRYVDPGECRMRGRCPSRDVDEPLFNTTLRVMGNTVLYKTDPDRLPEGISRVVYQMDIDHRARGDWPGLRDLIAALRSRGRMSAEPR